MTEDTQLINNLRLLNELAEEYEAMGEEISARYKTLLDMGVRWGLRKEGIHLFLD